MKPRSNPKCLACGLAMERFNGRWCLRLNRNVEYCPTPPCDNN